MTKDNTTPMNASEYDKKINQTIPFYQDFYEQTKEHNARSMFSGAAICRWEFWE